MDVTYCLLPFLLLLPALRKCLHCHFFQYLTDGLLDLQAQKLLDNILETTLELVEHSNSVPCDDDSKSSEGGIRLFKNAPVGVVFDHVGKYFNYVFLFEEARRQT